MTYILHGRASEDNFLEKLLSFVGCNNKNKKYLDIKIHITQILNIDKASGSNLEMLKCFMNFVSTFTRRSYGEVKHRAVTSTSQHYICKKKQKNV